jgi:hypothetical protein
MISPNENEGYEGHLEGFVSKNADKEMAKAEDALMDPKRKDEGWSAWKVVEREGEFMRWALQVVVAAILGVLVIATARVVLVEMHKTEQIRMILELEKLREKKGTQVEKGTLGKNRGEKSGVEF